MTTDDLIAALARTPEVARPRRFNARMALAALAGLALGMIVIKFTLGFRPDIGVAAPIVAAKAGLSALIATFAGGLALTLARPHIMGSLQASRAAGPLAIVVITSLLIGMISLFATNPENRFQAFTNGGFPMCVILIPFFGLPTAGLLMWVAKDGAPTRLALAGASIGALSGSVGAIVYAMFCPIDSVAFVTIWYVVGIGVASAMGGLAGIRLLRW